MEVMHAFDCVRFPFWNRERTSSWRKLLRFMILLRELALPGSRALVRLSKIEDYLLDNLYMLMLSELKAWVNKKRGWLRARFQIGNLAAVFRKSLKGLDVERCPALCYRVGGGVEIESRWTARRREQLGVYPVVRRRDVS
jgi:hypothetical protein